MPADFSLALLALIGGLYISQFYLYRTVGEATANIEHNQQQLHKHLQNPHALEDCDLCENAADEDTIDSDRPRA